MRSQHARPCSDKGANAARLLIKRHAVSDGVYVVDHGDAAWVTNRYWAAPVVNRAPWSQLWDLSDADRPAEGAWCIGPNRHGDTLTWAHSLGSSWAGAISAILRHGWDDPDAVPASPAGTTCHTLSDDLPVFTDADGRPFGIDPAYLRILCGTTKNPACRVTIPDDGTVVKCGGAIPVTVWQDDAFCGIVMPVKLTAR